MRIDVAFAPLAITPADVAGRTVVVVDILRATTCIAVALTNGAKAVLPAASSDEALRIAQNLERDAVVLAGERKSLRIPGFALGNSPGEFTTAAVGGKTVVMTTSNGTQALIAAQGAREVIAGAAVNFSAVVARARAALQDHGQLLVLCGGGDRQFALVDAFAAGRLTKVLLPEGGLKQVEVNDGALAALELARHYGERWGRALKASTHGRELAALGFRTDLEACATQDSHPVLPLYADRRITAHRARPKDDRERRRGDTRVATRSGGGLRGGARSGGRRKDRIAGAQAQVGRGRRDECILAAGTRVGRDAWTPARRMTCGPSGPCWPARSSRWPWSPG